MVPSPLAPFSRNVSLSKIHSRVVKFEPHHSTRVFCRRCCRRSADDAAPLAICLLRLPHLKSSNRRRRRLMMAGKGTGWVCTFFDFDCYVMTKSAPTGARVERKPTYRQGWTARTCTGLQTLVTFYFRVALGTFRSEKVALKYANASIQSEDLIEKERFRRTDDQHSDWEILMFSFKINLRFCWLSLSSLAAPGIRITVLIRARLAVIVANASHTQS